MLDRSETLTSVSAAARGYPIALLTYVLSYDDLLADEGRAFVALEGRSGELGIGRSATGRQVQGGVLRLPDERISREQALLRRHAREVTTGVPDERHGEIVDTIEEIGGGSKNGTFVNGMRIAQ